MTPVTTRNKTLSNKASTPSSSKDASAKRAAPRKHYVGLDVSLKETSIRVLDEADKIEWRGSVASTPNDLVTPSANMRRTLSGSAWRQVSCRDGSIAK